NKSLVNDGGIAAETLHPRFIAEHEYRWSAGLVIRELHHPPEQCRHAQKFKRSRRDVIAVETQRPFSGTIQYIDVVVANHPVKHVILLDIVPELRAAEPRSSTGLIPFRVVDLHGHKALRIRVGKRLHHDVVDDAENGG